jgi:hypothetical protein
MERDKLKDTLRELELEQRKLEAELKILRQREIQTKREIEALGTLLEIHDAPDTTKKKPREGRVIRLRAAKCEHALELFSRPASPLSRARLTSANPAGRVGRSRRASRAARASPVRGLPHQSSPSAPGSGQGAPVTRAIPTTARLAGVV